MDRRTFGKKSLNTYRPRIDRFVAPRDSISEYRRRLLWGERGKEHTGVEIWCAKYLKQKKYMTYLDEKFNLDPVTVLEHKDSVANWPCVPRKRSYLSTADSVLDLPTYSDATFPELLDWSNDNILVAALGRNYHKWSWRSQSIIGQGCTQNEIQCCKFDPRGRLLLLGTTPLAVEVHDNALSKCLYRKHCCCINLNMQLCSITAIDWSPTGNLFVMGCSRGILSALSRESLILRRRQVVLDTILVVKVSPDARFVAAAPLTKGVVLVFSSPELKLYSRLNVECRVKTLNWHPWRSALLGIGYMTSDLCSHIIMWDIPSQKCSESDIGRKPNCLDAMLFSHRTGEMVLSLLSLGTTQNICSQIVVMSDINTVVDQWGEGSNTLNRIRTMVFSPDGTKLATATADEDLIIWNFLPEDKNAKTNKKNYKRFWALPEYIDIATFGMSIR